MSRIESTFGVPDAVAQKTSGLAIGSLVCSLIVCCPIATIVGPLLGIVALVKIGGNPALKGRGIALAAILMGVVFTGAMTLGGYRFWETFGVPVMKGPRDALTAGFVGDLAGFKDAFHGAGANATDAEAQAFIDELRDRYGEFTGSRLDQRRGAAQPAFGQPSAPFPYVLSFDRDTVAAEAEIIFFDEGTDRMVMKPASLTVFDPDLGDLTYPPSEGESDETEVNGNGDPETGDGG
ncbi:MAG: DUF4190 domain-containing protein [Planctomycetes bacterium]|nr:DUF4190 domain-containing protein [Planctomycetota bacterium]